MNKIIEKYYYIIKVDCATTSKIYYKIGETCTKDRHRTLVEKYEKLRTNTATVLEIAELPHNEKKRLSDKMIHSHIDSTKFKKVDPAHIAYYLKEEDGKNEFFEQVDTSVNIVDYVKELVVSLSKNKYYTAKNTFDTTLNYDKDEDKYHLVDTDILNKIINKYSLVNKSFYKFINSNILLIGQFDFDFIATIAGIHNIYLWHDSAEQKHEYTYSFINERIHYINSLKELLDMSDIKFDVVISNPPYKDGAEITHNIIDNIEFDQFVNLLPANDYHRGTDDLYKYVDIKSMTSIKNGFRDAAVTTHLTLINKQPSAITEDEFEIENYIDDSLKKYFYENRKREHYAIDECKERRTSDPRYSEINPKTTFIIGHREPAAKMFGKIGTITYKWNYLKSLVKEDLHIARKNELTVATCIFNTESEKNNFVKFVYSKDGYKFMCKIFTAINVDSYIPISKYGPKVDWKREWTVEEILADYGYTEEEIKEVMDDLNNFKYMED